MSQSLLFQPAIRVSQGNPWEDLRYYQAEACEAVLSGFEEYRSQLIVLATGGGKTQIFCAIARKWPGKVLVLAHRDELVEQARARLEQMTGEQVDVEQAGRQASIFARLVVASVDTIKQQKRLDRFGKDHFGLVIADECFPAGTLVDGVPIERVAVGDIVSCVDHATGRLAFRKVTHRFERMAPTTVTLYTGATSLECTGNHPVYIRRGESVGYVQAEKVVPGDLLCMFRRVRADDCDRVPGATDVLEQVSVLDLLSDDGGDQPPLCVKTHDRAQPDATGFGASEDVCHAPGNEARPIRAPGEWSWAYGCRAGDSHDTRVGDQCSGAHAHAAGLGLSDELQAGCGEQGAEGRNRGRRDESLRTGQAGPGCKEGEVLAWVRVDRVARNEPAGPGGTRVYNLEVEGCHTYFANDILVHNCHHFLAATYRRPLDYFSGAKLLGVTATPDRADEKALGKLFENVAYCFDIRQGIDQGYLVPLIGRQIELGEIELDGVATVAGDLAKGQLDEVMLRAVEGIVKKTLELEPDRQAVCFFPGVKSAEYATERFNALDPMSAAFISGETLPHIRKGIVSDFRDGRIKRLCNCMVATEGFDAPAASCIVQARPTKSRGLYAQMVGRGTRVLGGLVEAIPGREGAAERRALIAGSRKRDCVILDFVGNATKHALVTPEDLLGGDYSDEEVQLAKKKAKGADGANPVAMLEEARKELQRVAAAIKSKVAAQARMFDPFAVLDVDLTSTTREDMRWGRQPPTERQMEALVRMKLPKEALKNISQREARKLLAERSRRHDAGLATYAQLGHLKKYGIDNPNVSFEAAGRALTYIASVGWKEQKVDRLILGAMIGGTTTDRAFGASK